MGQFPARLKKSKEVSAAGQNEPEGEEQVRSESGGLTLGGIVGQEKKTRFYSE